MPDSSNRLERMSSVPTQLVPYQRHDKMFRAFMENPVIAEQFYRAFLPPEIVGLMEDTPPVLVPGTYLGETLEESRSDVVHEIAIRSDKIPRFYGLVEHKSSKSKNIVGQVRTYADHLRMRDVRVYDTNPWEPPAVVSTVLYHGREEWDPPRSLQELVNRANAPAFAQFPIARFNFIDLWRFEMAKLAKFPQLRSAMQVIKGPPFGELLPELGAIPNQGDLLVQAYWYLANRYTDSEYYRGAGVDRAEQLMLALRPRQKEQEIVMNSIVAFLREDGRVEGAAGVLVRQLELKFGELTEAVRRRISAASREQIEQWVEGILHARTLDDLFGETEDPA